MIPSFASRRTVLVAGLAVLAMMVVAIPNAVVAQSDGVPAAVADLDPQNVLVIEVSGGPIYVELLPGVAPQHVDRIKQLAREGFYDGVVFHRVIDGFMAQGGDPTGTGMGGSKLPDLKQEFSSEPHVRGVCSMARSANPDSANSQFFICFGDASFLDGQYTVWGEVIEGMENVDQFARGEPVRNPDQINTAKLV